MSRQPANRRTGLPCAVLGPDWWARGLAPHERPADPTAPVDRPSWADRVEQLLRTAAPQRAAQSPGAVPQRAAEPPGSAAPQQPAGRPGADSWLDAFAVPLYRFVADARDRLVDHAAPRLAADHADLPAIAEGFAATLGRRLARTAARTLVLELNLARTAGRLTGADTRQRFADFLRDLAEPAGLARLFGEYPVLARLLEQASRFAVEAHLELLNRYAADRPAMVRALLDGVEPGPVVAIEAGRGDPHRRGRSVAILSFADQRRVVYKPRSLAAQVHLARLVHWLNQEVPRLDLRTPATVTGAEYGWLEFIPARPLADLAGAERFYRRQGALLALLHVVRAADVHCENLIACGDQPVLVDAETLFHPTLPMPGAAADPAADALAASVHRTALLPLKVIGENGALDMSGLGGDRGKVWPTNVVDWDRAGTDQMRLVRRPVEFSGELNRPRLGDCDIDPGDHEAALLHGFRLSYDAVLRHRPEIAARLAGCAEVEVRVVARPTRWYASLLDESTHPDLLRDGLDRDRALAGLRALSDRDPLRQRLIPHELIDLWAGDVPFFAGRPAVRDVWASDGQRLPDLLDASGLESALEKVAGLGERDRRDQEWIISATLASRQPAGQHRSTDPMPGPVTGSAAEPGRLLTVACGLADQIVALGATDADRVNWLGLELVDEAQWMVLPMGAGLASGYLGVALFLAQLAELTGVARYREVARRAVAAVRRTCAALAERPDLVATVGCGGFAGFGGIGYALARLATLLGDADLRQLAGSAVELAAVAAGSLPDPAALPEPSGLAGLSKLAQPSGLAGPSGSTGPPDVVLPPGVAAGTAGCLAAMTAIRTELGLDAAARLADRCADSLAGLVERTGGRCFAGDRPAPAGFADGTAGIGWALARFAVAGGGERYARAARIAMEQTAMAANPASTDGPGYGWCTGLAGVSAARAVLPAISGGAVDVVGPALAVRALIDRPVLRDLSLCHGELGITEALTVLAAGERSPAVARARRRRAGLILDAIHRYGPSCGVPRGVPTPGLLTGLAGIGYGLLRLGFAERVPSVLLLEPTPRALDADRLPAGYQTTRPEDLSPDGRPWHNRSWDDRAADGRPRDAQVRYGRSPDVRAPGGRPSHGRAPGGRAPGGRGQDLGRNR